MEKWCSEPKWTVEKANEWYAKTPWPCGFNFVTDTATNSTDMWQDADFDAPSIENSMAAAEKIGYNCVRVFLPFIVWEAERETFIKNMDRFMAIAYAHGIKTVPIFFDDCGFDDYGDGDPDTLYFKGHRDPFLGKQMEPKDGVNNARWTPSPGFRNADDPNKQAALKEYVQSIIRAFGHDERILFWDMYNEPDQAERGIECLPLLVSAFRWAREIPHDQPLSAGVWYDGDSAAYHACIELSDVISFHCYWGLEITRRMVERLKTHNRPLLITEWLNRPTGCTVEDMLPYYHEENIGCIQWGLWPGHLLHDNLTYETMGKNGIPNANPELWQHCVLHADGTSYKEEEIKLFKKLLGKA
ncbi:MAG: hypothetical protein E7324_00275 [Clostridiales bacterium]|nr:hypothetical protein [Clostridiales bacterium]